MRRVCVFWRREAASLAVHLESSSPGTHRRSAIWQVGFLFLCAQSAASGKNPDQGVETLERTEKWEEDFDEFLSGLNGKTTEDLGKALVSNESQILRELA